MCISSVIIYQLSKPRCIFTVNPDQGIAINAYTMLHGQRRSYGDKRETTLHSLQKKEPAEKKYIKQLHWFYYEKLFPHTSLRICSSINWLPTLHAIDLCSFFYDCYYIFVPWLWPIFDAFWTQCRQSCTHITILMATD